MIITRDQWLAALREYIGTKFHHQGRKKGVGVDCIGLLECAATDLRLPHEANKIRGYERAPNVSHFEKWCTRLMEPLSYNRLQRWGDQFQAGDVLIFWIDNENLPRHISVYTGLDKYGDECMIHSFAKKPHAVVEQRIDTGYWGHRLVSAWQLPHFAE